jgi:hypothetical protein
MPPAAVTGSQVNDLASGLLNSARQCGGSIGLAVLVTVAATVTSHHADPASLAAVTAGYARVLSLDDSSSADFALAQVDQCARATGIRASSEMGTGWEHPCRARANPSRPRPSH